MKRYKKKELLAVTVTLKKANELISKQGKNIPSAVDVLSQCQKSAILMGNYLETRGETGLKIVKILEDYCENIYQMSMELESDVQRKTRAGIIKKQLMQIENVIQYDMPVEKREIVFFPYKASMWDCMESIWAEAVKDERCETYVVPIPYYDKNSDGTLGRMFYEGLELPKEIHVTDWKDYHLEERMPDVAYIHNPYDSCNKVTSIHPDFYIQNLRKYVDKIVYVPYFATMNYVENHFCVLPGTLYTDAVVVQTEKVKQEYLEALSEFERDNNLQGTFTKNRNKFCVFGSPKFDKVLNMEQFQYEVPEEWNKLIYRKDGVKKKIILFNTSVQELLLHKEEQIEKIRRVIELFDQREDIVLLWRPHPLNESTVKSMMPQLLKKYLELEKEFQDKKRGIFDNTADLHRAITISDAYYGTGGSLIPLYGLTGKPIMRENTQLLEIESNLKNRFLSVADVYVDENGVLWFCAIDFNGLFKYDIANDELTWKGRFPNEGYEMRYRYSKCIAYKDKLFFPPYAAEEIAVYDMQTGEFQKIPINNYGIKSQKIYALAQYNEKLFCFGAQMPVIICLDMDTYEITYFEGVHQELKRYFINDSYPILNRDTIVEDNICFLSSGRANIVLEFHMDDMSYQIHQVGKDTNYYISMKKFKDKFYLLPRNAADITCWDYKNGRVYEIETPGNKCEENAYFNTCEYDGELWLFAFKGQHISKIVKGKEEIEILEDMSAYEKDDIFHENAQDFQEQKISWAYSDDVNIYYFSTMNRTFYIRNGKTGEITKRHLVMKEEDFLKARVSYMFRDRKTCETASQCIYKESNRVALSNYMDWILTNDNLRSEEQVHIFLSENAEGHADCGRLCHERFDLEE